MLSHISPRHYQLRADYFSETPWGDSPTSEIIGSEHKEFSCSSISLQLEYAVHLLLLGANDSQHCSSESTGLSCCSEGKEGIRSVSLSLLPYLLLRIFYALLFPAVHGRWVFERLRDLTPGFTSFFFWQFVALSNCDVRSFQFSQSPVRIAWLKSHAFSPAWWFLYTFLLLILSLWNVKHAN